MLYLSSFSLFSISNMVMVQLSVECIFCSACICFVECCPQEGITGFYQLSPSFSSLGNRFLHLVFRSDMTLLCFSRKVMVWVREFCVRLANQCRQVWFLQLSNLLTLLTMFNQSMVHYGRHFV